MVWTNLDFCACDQACKKLVDLSVNEYNVNSEMTKDPSITDVDPVPQHRLCLSKQKQQNSWKSQTFIFAVSTGV